MLPGVGVFGTGSAARVLVPLLRAEGFSIEALWGKTEEEARQLAEEMNISFYTSRTDDVLLHQDVDLVCINIPPPLTRQIAVKALGTCLSLELHQSICTNPSVACWQTEIGNCYPSTVLVAPTGKCGAKNFVWAIVRRVTWGFFL